MRPEDLFLQGTEHDRTIKVADAILLGQPLLSSFTEELTQGAFQDLNRAQRMSEQLREVNADGANQVAAALHLLDQELGTPGEPVSRSVRALCTIVRHHLFPQWSERQQEYFVETAIGLADHYDFFLSFSDRPNMPEVDGVLEVNYHNHYFIKRVLGPVQDARLSSENMVATAVRWIIENHRVHRAEGLRGYDYRREEGNSAPTEEKIIDAMERSRVFVQILHNDMFAGDEDRNFSYREFRMCEDLKLPAFYIHAIPSDERTDLELVSKRFGPWVDSIRKADALQLARTSREENAVTDAMRKKVYDTVANGVARARRALIDGAPDH